MIPLDPGDLLSAEALLCGKGGTTDYTALENLPTINGETVTGNLSGADLHLATLDSGGRVPAEQLPSYVDDVEEYASTSAFPATGEAGKIYVALDTNTQYGWRGTQYVVIANYIAPAVEAPPMDGTAAVGTATEYARANHRHPTDTSRASTDLATQSAAGLMSAEDKTKLDGQLSGADAAARLQSEYRCTCPSNRLFVDGAICEAYVETPPLKLSHLLDFTSVDPSLDIVHPAFMVGGEQKRVYVGKFQASRSGTKLYSLGGEDPANTINLDVITQYARNKGAGFHEITLAEWALRALLAKKRGTKPKGNNNYGRDYTESLPGGFPTFINGQGRTCRVATGTGPVTWSDTGDTTGCWDLNGNVLEWIIGGCLRFGVLYVIPNNDAALASTDLSANSAAWRVINAEATTWNDLFLDPADSASAAKAVKLDWVNSHWQWQKAAIADSSETTRNAAFANTTIAADVGAVAALYLRAMALAPDDGASASDYDGDYFFANNANAEKFMLRGGGWDATSYAGVFYLNLFYGRSSAGAAIGGRTAYYE